MKPSGLLLFILLILSFSISGQILNRSFELATSMEPNSPPLHWQYQNHAFIFDEFTPQPERGVTLNWSIKKAYEGDNFVVTSTGNLGPGTDAAIREAKLFQRILVHPWTLIKGVYFFGTSDYRPYYDHGKIELVPYNDPNNPCDPNDPNNPYGCPQSIIEIARCSVNEVGDFGSTGDWIPFAYTILPNQAGFYDLVMTVKDGTDAIYESYFAIDDVSICGPGSPQGDVTRDCTVNIEDLSYMSMEWLGICSIDPNTLPDPNDPDYISDPNDPNYIDPNNLTDPNCMCADFNRNNIVDPNDLVPVYENWLIKDI